MGDDTKITTATLTDKLVEAGLIGLRRAPAGLIGLPTGFSRGSTGLCLSGGGSKGAFQVGVLEYLAEHSALFPEGFSCGAGTSVGAVNIAGLAMTPPSARQIEDLAAFVIRCWERLARTEDVWRLRMPPYAAGLWNPSIGDNAPLRKLLRSLVDLDRVMAGTPCSVVAWDLLAGKGKTWDLREAANVDQLVSFLLASSSFPIAFPPERIGSALYTDGGIVDIAPTRRLIRQGADHIVAVLCRNPEIPEPKTEAELRNAAAVGLRCLDGMEDEIVRGDLQQIRLWNRLVALGDAPTKREIKLTVVMPHEPLGDALDFSPALARKRRIIGREAARRAFQEAA